MKLLASFNHKGGVGKTTMTTNLACRLSEHGNRCLIIDADPQCNSTIACLPDSNVENIYTNGEPTLYTAVQPLIGGTGDLKVQPPDKLEGWDVYILPGDLFVSRFEDILAREWNTIFKPEERGARLVSALFRLAKNLGDHVNADYVFFDLGPSIGPLNQFALLACDAFLVPVTPDVYSARAVTSVGRTVREWIDTYAAAKQRLDAAKFEFEMPPGSPQFAGYIPQQFGIFRKDPTIAFKHWISEIETRINDDLIKALAKTDAGPCVSREVQQDPKICQLKNYHSLVPASQEHHRPIFALKGNIHVNPGHAGRVNECGKDYDRLVRGVVERVGA